MGQTRVSRSGGRVEEGVAGARRTGPTRPVRNPRHERGVGRPEMPRRRREREQMRRRRRAGAAPGRRPGLHAVGLLHDAADLSFALALQQLLHLPAGARRSGPLAGGARGRARGEGQVAGREVRTAAGGGQQTADSSHRAAGSGQRAAGSGQRATGRDREVPDRGVAGVKQGCSVGHPARTQLTHT